jgi:hypothetical protein
MNFLQNFHSQISWVNFHKIECIVIAVYLLYCLMRIKLFAGSLGLNASIQKGAAALAKSIFTHCIIFAALAAVIVFFSKQLSIGWLNEFFSNRPVIAIIAFIIPVVGMGVAFLLGMTTKNK